MKKKQLLIISLLLSIIINAPTVFAQQSSSALPPMLQDLKGKNEIISYFNEISDVRKNISTININALTAKENSSELEKKINFYLTQLKEIELKISNFNKTYSDSEPDLLFTQQLSLIIEAYKMSLNQQLSLITGLINNDPNASTLFDSKYLTYIYYYINLGDQMVAYINTYYSL